MFDLSDLILWLQSFEIDLTVVPLTVTDQHLQKVLMANEKLTGSFQAA
jgi:hypothetical protein